MGKLFFLATLMVLVGCNEQDDTFVSQLGNISELDSQSKELDKSEENTEEKQEQLVEQEEESQKEETNEDENSNSSGPSATHTTCESVQNQKQVCRLSSAVEMGIKSFVVDKELSTPECFEKRNYRINRRKAKVVVRRGCSLSFQYELANVESKEIDLIAETQVYDFGDISLSKRYRLGSSVEVLEASGMIATTNHGVGVKGGVHAPDQINFDPVTGEFQGLGFNLSKDDISMELTLSRMFKNESTGERAIVIFLNSENEIVGKRGLRIKDRHPEEHEKTFKVNIPFQAQSFLILPRDYKNDEETRTDSSDFFVKQLKFHSVK